MKLPIRYLSAAGVALAAAATLSAADFHDWAPTPPMGWNSFDCFGLSLTEAQAKELFTALKDARYLMGGLPLASIDTAEGVKVRVDL